LQRWLVAGWEQPAWFQPNGIMLTTIAMATTNATAEEAVHQVITIEEEDVLCAQEWKLPLLQAEQAGSKGREREQGTVASTLWSDIGGLER
jgi:hypothetical protein